MKTIELSYPHELPLSSLPKTSCAIGFFDGIHKGHQRVITEAVEQAKEEQMESAVITFHPHPSVVLRKEKTAIKYITPLKEKKEILSKMGVDRLYIITFNKKLSTLSPQEFIDHFIIGLNIKHLVAGFDFSYGFKGQGNMQVIGDHARGAFTYKTIDKVMLDGEKISSTRIRNLLKEGKISEVNQLLGRTFLTTGRVIEGDKRGRDLGYPTANIDVHPDALLPKTGIYAVQVIHQNEIYNGMASLGTNPTFTADRIDLSLEVNILDYNNDIYGEELQIAWFKYIRDEEQFDSVEALIKQMDNDERVIRSFFTTSPVNLLK